MSTPIIDDWRRRDFLTRSALAGAASLLGVAPAPLAAEPPLDTTSVRFEWAGGACTAPKYVAEELLRAEGFTDVQYVNKDARNLTSRRLKTLSSGEADFDLVFVPDLVLEIEKASPIVILAG